MSRRCQRSSFLAVLLACTGCDGGEADSVEVVVEVSPEALVSFEKLTEKPWRFFLEESPSNIGVRLIEEAALIPTSTVEDGTGSAQRLAECRGGGARGKVLEAGGKFYQFTVTSPADLYEGCAKSRTGVNLGGGLSFSADACLKLDPKDDREGLWMMVSDDGKNASTLVYATGTRPWSHTLAMTPGGHHVRLYLETEGKIKTLISEKDNFVKFHSESSPKFFTADGLLLTDLRPRDPNITMSEAGVYALTWDNRPATADYGPGGSKDSDALSPTFGLAFSVDGLEWTVYSNEMSIEKIPPEKCSEPYDYHGVPTTSCTYYGGSLRHVVPIFVSDEQIRLYFTHGVLRPYSPSGSLSLSCSLGTAISN